MAGNDFDANGGYLAIDSHICRLPGKPFGRLSVMLCYFRLLDMYDPVFRLLDLYDPMFWHELLACCVPVFFLS